VQILTSYAVSRDCTVIPLSDLEPEAAAILRRIAQVGYVLEQHNLAVARHTHTLVALRAELECLRGRS